MFVVCRCRSEASNSVVVILVWRTGMMSWRNGTAKGKSAVIETELKDDVPSGVHVNINVNVALGSSLKPELQNQHDATAPKCPGATCCPKHADVMEPWLMEKFKEIKPSSSDHWCQELLCEGWLYRQHGKERKQSFHPCHRSTPLPLHELLPGRVQVRFCGNKPRAIICDEWTQPMKTVKGEELWRGFTFFQLKPKKCQCACCCRHSSYGSSDSSACNSFEFVDE